MGIMFLDSEKVANLVADLPGRKHIGEIFIWHDNIITCISVLSTTIHKSSLVDLLISEVYTYIRSFLHLLFLFCLDNTLLVDVLAMKSSGDLFGEELLDIWSIARSRDA